MNTTALFPLGAVALVELTKFPLLAALPGALFSVWHNISGSLLAGWWGRESGAGPKSQGSE